MTSIKFAGHDFELHFGGCLYWPLKQMLIVSDLHFEKGSSYASRGVFLPPHDTHETLSRLSGICDGLKPKTILFLGDVFHDRKALERIADKDRDVLMRLLVVHDVIWVEGNHDSGGVIFNHIAEDGVVQEISGHYHPSVKFSHKEQKVRRPCFVHSDDKIILPSFGAFTGGLDITDPIYNSIFTDKFDIYALGHKNVHPVKQNKVRA